MVGIRAYQWGWEYYYPKEIDLNYNVRPSYSSFIGNSLKYTPAPSRTLSSNAIWRHYQNTRTSSNVTPAHLLLTPMDNSKVINFMNFKDIGVDTVQASAAFKKIRAYSKVYSSNLTHTTDSLTAKYNQINNTYLTDNVFTDSLAYGNYRQHNLTSVAATSAHNASLLDEKSMEQFLNYTAGIYNPTRTTDLGSRHPANFRVPFVTSLSTGTGRLSSLLSESSTANVAKRFGGLALYPQIIDTLNNDSDAAQIHYPLRKLFTERGELLSLHNSVGTKLSGGTDSTSGTLPTITSNFNNFNDTSKLLTLNSTNNRLLPAEQSVRLFQKLMPTESNLNLSNGLTPLASSLDSRANTAANGINFYYNYGRGQWLDLPLTQKLASNRMFLSPYTAPVRSNNPRTDTLNYDTTTTTHITPTLKGNKLSLRVESDLGEDPSLLQNPSDTTPVSMHTAY